MVGGSPTMPGKPGDQPSTARPADPNAAGPMPLRRLTQREYNNTIRDLLGDTSKPADSFPPDQESDFTFRRAGLVATVDATRLGGAAETLATAAEARFATLVPCAPAAPADEEPCARKFIESFGLRAYRRPLDAAEVERHLKLYRDGRGPAQLDLKGAIRLLIEAMLQSPHFVYRWELGPGSRPAARARWCAWAPTRSPRGCPTPCGDRCPTRGCSTPPRPTGWPPRPTSSARPAGMLADPRASDDADHLRRGAVRLRRAGRPPQGREAVPRVEGRPEGRDDRRAAGLRRASAVFDGDAKLDTLLAADFSFVNQPLAALYGKTGVTGAAMARTDLNPDQRAGLLTLAPWLTLTGASDGSHPVMRGKMIYERLLCGELPPPPPDVPEPKPPADGLTTRERFAEHGQQACADRLPRHHGSAGLRLRELRRPGQVARHRRRQAGGRHRQASTWTAATKTSRTPAS